MLLKKYIASVLSESFSFGRVKEIVDELNRVSEEYYREDRNYDLCYDIIPAVESFGLTKIGAGAYRKVYSSEGEDWVLKIAYGFSRDEFSGAKIDNADEVSISQGAHGFGARDLFVKVYDWDKISDNPVWLFSQKAVPLENAHKHFTISDMQKIFPTFWNSLKHDAAQRDNVRSFCTFVSDSMDELSSYSTTREKSKSGLTKSGFYRAISEGVLFDDDLVTFEEMKYDDDFIRVARACAYSRPDDMHKGNIGIVPSSAGLGPSSIVVLDYLISRPSMI